MKRVENGNLVYDGKHTSIELTKLVFNDYEEIFDVLSRHLYINSNNQIYLNGLKMGSKDYNTLKKWIEENIINGK